MVCRFLTLLLGLSLASGCKTSRPVIDISEPVYNPDDDPRNLPVTGNPSKNGGTSREPTKHRSFVLYGYGLAISVLENLEGAPSEKTFQDIPDGIFAADCRPFQKDEWKASALVLSLGRLYGSDFYFADEACRKKPLREVRDSLSVGLSDLESVLLSRKIRLQWDDTGFLLSYPSGEATKLKRLGTDEDTGGMAKAKLQAGYGLYAFAKEEGQVQRSPEALQGFSGSRYFVGDCRAYAEQVSYREALSIVDGKLYGSHLVFSDKDCLNETFEEKRDESALSIFDYFSLLRAQAYEARLTTESLLLVKGDEIRSYKAWPLRDDVEDIRFDGLGLKDFVTKSGSEGMAAGETLGRLSEGFYLKGCRRFTNTSWLAEGYAFAEGKLRGLALYYPDASCAGSLLWAARDTGGVSLDDFCKALTTAKIYPEFSEAALMLTFGTGAELRYDGIKAVTLP